MKERGTYTHQRPYYPTANPATVGVTQVSQKDVDEEIGVEECQEGKKYKDKTYPEQQLCRDRSSVQWSGARGLGEGERINWS